MDGAYQPNPTLNWAAKFYVDLVLFLNATEKKDQSVGLFNRFPA